MTEGLPQGWTSVALRDATTMIQYGLTASGRHARTGPRFLRITDIQDGKVDWATVPSCDIGPNDLAKYRLAPGDIVFARSGATTGKSFLIRSCPEGAVFASYLIRVRPLDGVRSEFLSLFFNSRTYWSYISDNLAGNAQPNCNGTKLAGLPVPIPPVAELKRIVAKVEELLAHANAARARLDRVPAILGRFRQAVLAAACSGRLTEDWRATSVVESLDDMLARVQFTQSSTGRSATENVIPGQCILAVGDPETTCPQGWRWLPLTAVARLESGHTPSRKHPEYWRGNIPWIGIQDAGKCHGGRIHETRQHVSDEGLTHSSARLLPRGTVCLSRTASVGYVVIMGRPMATSQDFVNWICSDSLVPEFLLYALIAEGAGIKRFGRGTTHTTIYFPEVKALHICLPPVEEQREIVRRIEAMLPRTAQIERRLLAARGSAQVLSQAVLAKTFRGELVPTEAELARQERRDYEPASMLLQRIKAERREEIPRKVATRNRA